MSRRIGPMAAIVAAAVALGGCGGLSVDSRVRSGLEVGSAPANPVRVIFPGPADGATPEQIVSGFLRAGAASDQELRAARSYLSASSGTPWRPDTSIMVFPVLPDESALEVTTEDGVRVTVRAAVTASVDAAGNYRELPAGATAEASFGLEQQGGQWRIASVEEDFGLWLSATDFDRLYDPFRLHYLSTSGRTLVPDVRWFSVGSGLATRLVRAQLGGVPDYLRGAARTDIPAGTRLTVNAVPVSNGLATVDLAAAKPGGDPTRRQNQWAQFLATLLQVPEVRRVALKVEGTDLELPGVDGPPGSLSEIGFPAEPALPPVQPVLRSGATLRLVDPTGAVTEEDPPPTRGTRPLPDIGEGWAWLAMAKGGQEIAAVGGDRAEVARWRGQSQIRVPRFASSLTRPTYDRQDVLWVGGQADGEGGVWAINSAADPNDTERTRPQRVAAPWLGDREVVAVSVAPDGQRLALVSTAADGADLRVDVAGIVRAANGLPESLAEPLRVATTLTLARDLVWVDDTTIAVLGRKTAQESVRVWLAGVGGALTAAELADQPGAQSITTTNGARGLVVATDEGLVLIRAGSSWLPIGRGTDLLVAAA